MPVTPAKLLMYTQGVCKYREYVPFYLSVPDMILLGLYDAAAGVHIRGDHTITVLTDTNEGATVLQLLEAADNALRQRSFVEFCGAFQAAHSAGLRRSAFKEGTMTYYVRGMTSGRVGFKCRETQPSRCEWSCTGHIGQSCHAHGSCPRCARALPVPGSACGVFRSFR